MRRLPAILAVLAVALTIPGAVTSSWVNFIDWLDVPIGIAFAAMGVGCAVIGGVVASRVPGNAVGWIILSLGLGVGVMLTATGYAELGVLTTVGPLPAQSLAAWTGDVLGIPIFFGLTGLLLLLFPTGRALSRSWRVFTVFFVLLVTAATLSYGLAPGEIGPGVTNPLGLPGGAGEASRLVADVTDYVALPSMLGCAAAVLVRLRRSVGVERQQLKWFTYCAACAGVGLGVTILGSGIFADAAFVFGLLGVTLLPITAGVAILRYRLYDIDVVLKRTLVYATLTAVLVATYLVLVLALQALLRPLAGDSDLAVAGSTLAVAALFRPLRSAIQQGVDRRFFRSRYDAARTLDGFTDRLRNELDLEQLGSDLRSVVLDTMQPDHVSLWIRDRS